MTKRIRKEFSILSQNDVETEAQPPAVEKLLFKMYKFRVDLDRDIGENETDLDQVKKHLFSPHENTADYRDLSISTSYAFGKHVLKAYPDYIALKDTRKSLGTKVDNLKRKGVREEVADRFKKIADPTWGTTFRGIRIDDVGFHAVMDRTKTYHPFRQKLKFAVTNSGKITWQFQSVLYDPKALYFRTPTDTMGASTPEFTDGYTACPVLISGTVSNRGKLEFTDAYFGGFGFETGVPRYEVARATKSKISFKSLRTPASHIPFTDYEIKAGSFRDMIQYFRKDGADIDTGSLLAPKVINNRFKKKK